MALRTAEEFVQSIRKMKPRVFMNGKKIENILDNPVTKTVVDSNRASYEWALDSRYQDIMTTISPLTKERINRYTHVSQSIQDLVDKANAGTFTSENLGTCIYRCVGLDTFHSLWANTWEMDHKLGTSYFPRFQEYLKYVQNNDLSVAGALTEPRGLRHEELKDWPDPYLSLKIMERKSDGIVVNGCKINISGAYAGNELVVLPQMAHYSGEEDYAVAFAIPADTEGVTYICQYTPESAEREQADNIYELGNPVFGQRETSMVVFDNVFVPWERVFHCGELEYSGKLVERFARTHRMTCGGTCKVGFMNIIIGACKLLQEYKGLKKATHINDEIIEMVVLRETAKACGLTSATLGCEDPAGSGVFLPNEIMGNVSKLNVCHSFWRVLELAGDIAGGLAVTLPSMKELSNPETREYVKKYLCFGSPAGAENIMKVTKVIQNWTSGLHGVGTYHGAGPVMTQKIMLNKLVNYDREVNLVKKALDIED